MYIASNEARVASVATLRNVVLPLAQCGYGNSMPMGRKGNLSCPKRTNNTGLIIKNAGYAISHRVADWSVLLYSPLPGFHTAFYSIFDNTIFVITILFLFLLFLSVYPLCNKPLHSRIAVFQHNTLFIFCSVQYYLGCLYIISVSTSVSTLPSGNEKSYS